MLTFSLMTLLISIKIRFRQVRLITSFLEPSDRKDNLFPFSKPCYLRKKDKACPYSIMDGIHFLSSRGTKYRLNDFLKRNNDYFATIEALRTLVFIVHDKLIYLPVRAGYRFINNFTRLSPMGKGLIKQSSNLIKT